MPDPLLPGVYDRVLTRHLQDALRDVAFEEEAADEAETPAALSSLLGHLVLRALQDTPHDQRVSRLNAVLEMLGVPDRVVTGPRLLQLVAPDDDPATLQRLRVRPRVPLDQPALLTGGPHDPKLGEELRAELATADGVDLLCAFVKWHGVRVLETPLHELARRGVPFRVLTSTYMGSTERRALDRLVSQFGAEVRINYETRSTRLHAKAWLFRRHSGTDTAYVGSSNLSKAALLDGLEWNVRLAAAHTPDMLSKFAATFEALWSDGAFLQYSPERDADMLDEALEVASGAQQQRTATFAVSGLEVRPYPHQVRILEDLATERDLHGRHRNLVVAATGTGKTVVAALDYRRMAGRPTLLFIAHRKEILEQSLRTYREVLNDGSFGELYVDGQRPERWQHVFASVQSLSAYGTARLRADAYEVVVVDEFHHAEAATYRRLLEHVRPQELLGLTATPERSDGLDVRDLFDGRTASELRLWDALEADLLCPFHYFGVSDTTDLTSLTWRRGDYDVHELSNVLTGDEARVRLLLTQLADKVGDMGRMRALGFCVSVAHAEFMAASFEKAGVPALAVSGNTPAPDRAHALARLRRRDVNVLFAVDLFNEGLDVPDVDTLLLLRPTQSATVFLQQLGRGLRRTPDKPVLTVIDLIGQQRREFRFDLKYRALTGTSRAELERQVARGFAFLPSGCELVLDPVSRKRVLDNVRQQLRLDRRALARELRRLGDVDLATWLAETGQEPADVLRYGSWTQLRRAAGLPTAGAGPDEAALLRRVPALGHVNDQERAERYSRFLSQRVEYADLSARDQRFARMLFFTFWRNGGGFSNYQEGFDQLARHPAVAEEVQELLAVLQHRGGRRTRDLEAGMEQVPLATDAVYSQDEVLAALDYCSLQRLPSSFREGVLWSEAVRTDAFFVTLRKSNRDYSPSTMYRDYAIDPSRFHWESQNATSETSVVGRRYLSQKIAGTHVLLFVRETKVNTWGGTAAYTCLGPAAYESHRGSKPIAITYRLRHPMRVDDYRAAAVAL